MFSINVQGYSQNHAQNCIWATLWRHQGNIMLRTFSAAFKVSNTAQYSTVSDKQSIKYIGVTRIFRGWARPGVDPGFLVRARLRGQRQRAMRGRREAPRGMGLGRGAVAPTRSGGIAPRNLWNLTCKFVHSDAFLRLSQTLNLMQHVLILEV